MQTSKHGVKLRLTIMNFLQFAVWGSYLTSMGNYLGTHGLGGHIGLFYAMLGIVSIFMPALMGIVADRWIPAQRLLGLCHLIAALMMLGLCGYTLLSPSLDFVPMILLYSLSVAFYMPTLALSYSVSYYALEEAGYDIVKDFPSIRIFGTIGFICCMLLIDFAGLQQTSYQFAVSGAFGLLLFMYSFVLPHCPVAPAGGQKTLVEALGLKAFSLFRERKMALFFIFSMLLGVSLQVSNGFANSFITDFKKIPEFADSFGANHANALISLSQMSETLCILLIPFFLKRFGIKRVMLMAMMGWVLRFGFFAVGDPGPGVWLFVLSMIVYGLAFDFFNVSGSLFVDQETDKSMRSSAQGLFMLMTNGIGATLGVLGAQLVVDRFVFSETDPLAVIEGWSTSWYIFAGYSLLIAVLFAVFFRYRGDVEEVKH
ncbi:nucleoside permease [Porphyromonas sp. COT-239 OH1446]|uniref:nucleoside permease n=1 Tax=Porphyromonas sp. COT-239 OH1446 TaxID=1515613 RepID=UPI00052CAAAB|nr:nucleoside permease [Porphyromonas sp. COT-239 OH1446]KGN68415.1 nucleoside permease [Porphyromonas sp. COT-239 OH1446]